MLGGAVVVVATVLQAEHLVKVYGGRYRRSLVHAVSDVSLSLAQGSTLGIVGESGCGKSTLARLLVGLEAPTSGVVTVGNQTLDAQGAVDHRTLARTIQMVFQDPFSSLDPRLTVERSLAEVLRVHRLHTDRVAERTAELLGMVGLASRFASRYPHELSGGQAQRVAFARALAVEPQIFVLDEPTSSLDVSVRAEIINLLVGLQDQLHLSNIFISHDLSIVRHISDDIAVMYLGRVVEYGRYDQVLGASRHPYTVALADATPVPDPEHERSRPGAPRVPVVRTEVSAGCAYAPRCPLAESICWSTLPTLDDPADGHQAACFIAQRGDRIVLPRV